MWVDTRKTWYRIVCVCVWGEGVSVCTVHMWRRTRVGLQAQDTQCECTGQAIQHRPLPWRVKGTQLERNCLFMRVYICMNDSFSMHGLLPGQLHGGGGANNISVGVFSSVTSYLPSEEATHSYDAQDVEHGRTHNGPHPHITFKLGRASCRERV